MIATHAWIGRVGVRDLQQDILRQARGWVSRVDQEILLPVRPCNALLSILQPRSIEVDSLQFESPPVASCCRKPAADANFVELDDRHGGPGEVRSLGAIGEVSERERTSSGVFEAGRRGSIGRVTVDLDGEQVTRDAALVVQKGHDGVEACALVGRKSLSGLVVVAGDDGWPDNAC